MNQTLIRRVGMAFGIWTLLRYKTRLCRWSSIGEDDGSGTFDALEAPRWLGKVRIGRGTHHALLCPPSRPMVYRFLAPPRTKIVAWCALHPLERSSRGAEFCISVRTDGSTRHLTERLRLDPERKRDRGWRQLVLALDNEEPWQIEVTFTTSAVDGDNAAQTLWGEPKLEWPRPFSETSGLASSRLQPGVARTAACRRPDASWPAFRAIQSDALRHVAVAADPFGEGSCPHADAGGIVRVPASPERRDAGV